MSRTRDRGSAPPSISRENSTCVFQTHARFFLYKKSCTISGTITHHNSTLNVKYVHSLLGFRQSLGKRMVCCLWFLQSGIGVHGSARESGHCCVCIMKLNFSAAINSRKSGFLYGTYTLPWPRRMLLAVELRIEVGSSMTLFF